MLVAVEAVIYFLHRTWVGDLPAWALESIVGEVGKKRAREERET